MTKQANPTHVLGIEDIYTREEIQGLMNGFIAGIPHNPLTKQDMENVKNFLDWCTRVRVDNAFIALVAEGVLTVQNNPTYDKTLPTSPYLFKPVDALETETDAPKTVQP